MEDQKRIVVRIADVVFAVSGNRPTELLRQEDNYSDFLCTDDPEIIIYGDYDGLPDIELRESDRVFYAEDVWSLYRTDGKSIFSFASPLFGSVPYRIAIFEDDLRRGRVFNRPLGAEQSSDGLLPNPLEFPLSEILMVCLLAQGRGLMVHSCGVDDDGKGYLFAGNSTHGKSTMARQWRDKATILNDDRIILRRRDGRFWIYGTPWHGEYTGISSNGVPLEKIFFLRHSKTNDAIRKEDNVAASMLMTRCFPPLWDKEAMLFTLDFCSQLVSEVPCYDLGFVPEESVVDFIRCVE